MSVMLAEDIHGGARPASGYKFHILSFLTELKHVTEYMIPLLHSMYSINFLGVIGTLFVARSVAGPRVRLDIIIASDEMSGTELVRGSIEVAFIITRAEGIIAQSKIGETRSSNNSKGVVGLTGSANSVACSIKEIDAPILENVSLILRLPLSPLISAEELELLRTKQAKYRQHYPKCVSQRSIYTQHS